jgi:hypothetical protein
MQEIPGDWKEKEIQFSSYTPTLPDPYTPVFLGGDRISYGFLIFYIHRHNRR